MIGSGAPSVGPRSLIENFGAGDREGELYNPKVVRRMLHFLAPYRLQMLAALVLVLIETGLTLLTPYLMKVAIDQYIVAGDLANLRSIAIQIALAFGGLYVTGASQRYLLAWVGRRALADIRSEMFAHLQKLPMAYHDDHIVGVTVSRVMNDVAEINELLSQGVISLLGDILVLAGIIIVMISMDFQLALLTFTVIPLMAITTIWFSRRAKVAFRETRSRVARVVGDLAEDISSMRVIQAFSQEKTVHERFDQTNEANRETYVRAMSLSFFFLPAIEFLGMVATVIVLLAGGYYVIGGRVTLGVLVAFLSYVSRFFQPVQELSRLFTTLQSAMAGGEQVINLLDTVPAISDLHDAVDLPPISGRVKFEDVSFRYRPGGAEVLHDINLTIEPGQTVAIVGPTGAGKTTIARLVARFHDVTEGKVTIDGFDVRQVTQASLRHQVVSVPQEPFLFSRSLAENISFGNPGASQAEIEEAARMANAHEFISRLPQGYETRVLEGAANLSVGQRQLITLARAVLADPRILILDEATANIDPRSEALIQRALDQLFEGRTALVIAHRLSTIRNADQIYVLSEGRVIEKGKHAELLAAGGLYAALTERQRPVAKG